MDVELPDGTIVQGVPDDMSQADLKAKLIANGYKGFPDEERGYAERVLKEGLPAVGNMAVDMGKGLAAGFAGVGALARGEGMEGFESRGKFAQEEFHDTARMKSPEIQATEQSAMEGIDSLVQGLNTGAVGAVNAIPFVGPKLATQFEPEIRAAADVVTNLLPIPGVELAARGIAHPRLTREKLKLRKEAEAVQKQLLEQEAADRAFVEARQRDVALGKADAHVQEYGLEQVRQRTAELNQRAVTPEAFRTEEPIAELPKGTEPPRGPAELAQADPMARELGGKDLAPLVDAVDTPHKGLTEPNVQPTENFLGRAEHPINAVRNMEKAHDGLSEANVAKAVNELRDQWDRVESMMQKASDMRLEKTNLGTVKNGPYKTTLKLLEEKKAELQQEAQVLQNKYGDYLARMDEVTQKSMKDILEMNPRGQRTPMDRSAPDRPGMEWPWIEKSQGLNRPDPYAGLRNKQGGAITLSASMSDVKNGPLASAFKHVFNKLKREYPRFAEMRDIRLMTQKEWDRYVDGQVRTGHIDKKNAAEYKQASGVQTTGQHIRVNADHPIFRDGGYGALSHEQIVDTFAHELMHEFQDRRGRISKWEEKPELVKLPWAERPWEKQAIQAGETASTRVMHLGRNKPMRVGGKQGGGWTPFASSSKPIDALTKIKNDLKEAGIPDPDGAISKGILANRQGSSKWTPANEAAAVSTVTKQVPGLQKLTDQYINKWSPEEMTQAVVDWGKDIGAFTQNTVRKYLPGRFNAKDHPLLGYTSSFIHKVHTKSRMAVEDVLMGDAYDSKGRRIPADGSPMKLWSSFTHNSREVLNDVGQAFTNKSDALVTDAELNAKARELHGRDLHPAELQSYRDRRNGLDRAWKDMNDFIEANPKPNGALREPLPYLPNFWSPAEFSGKFLIFVKDPITLKVEAMQGSYFKPNKAKLEKMFPDKKVDFIEKNVGNNLNPEALEATIRYLAEPKREAVRKALNEAMKSQSFGKHGLKREGVAGWMGSEGGRKGVNNYEKVYEQYIRSMYNHITSQELGKKYQEISDNKTLRDVSPRAQQFALEMIDAGRGRINETMKAFEKAAGAALNEVKLPQSFLDDALRPFNEAKVKLLIAFGKTSQIAANLIQMPMTAPAKGLSITADLNMNTFNSAAANLKAAYKTMQSIAKPSVADIKDVIALRRLGALEAQFQWDYIAAEKGTAQGAMNSPKEWLTLTAPLTWIESNIVRKPAGLYFTHLLRDLKYPEADLHRLAAELTDQYEASTKLYESAHTFSRAGTVGRAIKPLQSFATTWVGSHLEHLETALRNPTSAAHALPIAYALGVLYTVTGLTGMPGVREWDFVVEKLNKMAGTKFQTGTETILKGDLGDWSKSNEAKFGWLWAKLHYAGGSTLAAPTATQSVAPGVQLMGQVATALGTGIANTGVFGEHNKPTSADKREALKGITPASTAGWTESYFSHPDSVSTMDRFTKNPTGTYTNNKGSGSIERNDRDWNTRKYLGGFTTDEAQKKAENWEVERSGKETAQHKSDLVRILVDQYIQTGKINGKLLERAGELGYGGKDLGIAMKRELMDHYLPKDMKMVKGGKTLKQQRAYQMLQELR